MSRRGGTDRHRAREAAVQLLYQWEIGRLDAKGLTEAADSTGPSIRVPRHGASWPPPCAGHDRPRRRDRSAPPRERGPLAAGADGGGGPLILRLAVYELLHTTTPRAVVINEALELAKTFGGDQTPRFVNGVLDAVSRAVAARPDASSPDVAGTPTSS